jgi:hypothetical protein
VHDAPGASAANFCRSGLTITPTTVLSCREPCAVAVAPVFVTLIFTVLVLPTFIFSGFFALVIEGRTWWRVLGAGLTVARLAGSSPPGSRSPTAA